MGILGRLSTLIKSNVNDVIDSMQDPAKEIDQMVRDMEESARQARTEVAQCFGEEKRLQKRVADLEDEAAQWGKRAETAVRAVSWPMRSASRIRCGQPSIDSTGGRR